MDKTSIEKEEQHMRKKLRTIAVALVALAAFVAAHGLAEAAMITAQEKSLIRGGEERGRRPSSSTRSSATAPRR